MLAHEIGVGDQMMNEDVEEEILPENAEDEAKGLMSRRIGEC